MYCVVGTAGHIDHGKTILVKALTNMDTDTLAEEKKRGVSIDLGFAHMEVGGGGGDAGDEDEKVRFGVVDVPGHERFIRNMLAGVSGIDIVLFVVAADDGVMPQTREHLDICLLLGIGKGVFAITKCDMAAPERVAEVRAQVEALLKGTVLDGSPIVDVSSVTGQGLEELKGLLRRTCLALSSRDDSGFFRLPVDRSFAIKGFGAVVTGTVASGTASVGIALKAFPNGAGVRIRGIQTHHQKAGSIGPGERAALNLSGASFGQFQRGTVLASPVLAEFAIRQGSGPFSVDCVLDLVHTMPKALKDRSTVKLHHLTSETLAVLNFLDKKEARAGQRVYARISLKEPLLMLRHDRFIIRGTAVSHTVGGGSVLLPYFSRKGALPPPLAKLDASFFNTLEKGVATEVLGALLDYVGGHIEKERAAFMLNISATALERLIEDSGAALLGHYVIGRTSFAGLRKGVLDAIGAHHAQYPDQEGMEQGWLQSMLAREGGGGIGGETIKALISTLVDTLVEERALLRAGSKLRLPAHTPRLAGVDPGIEGALGALFTKGFDLPTMDDIRGLPYKSTEVKRVLGFFVARGSVVRLTEGRYISNDSLKIAREKVIEEAGRRGGRIKASDLRDALGCGRRLAIEMLEYFDKERLTLRHGDYRTLRG